MWFGIIAGIILTLLVFFFLCCTPRKYHVPMLFVTNLLISNLVIICSFLHAELMPEGLEMGGLIYNAITGMIFLLGLMNSNIFRTCIAVERYKIITRPNYTRGIVASVLACVGPWVLCFLILYFGFAAAMPIIIYLSCLLPVILSIIFVVLTFSALPAAISVDVEEKRRTMGVLVLLLVDYFVLMLPAFIICIYSRESVAISKVLFLFTVFVDLVMAVLIFEGPADKFLARLCYTGITTDDTVSH